MERISINYHGQDFSKEEKAQIKADLAFHLGDAPSDATACCCLSREKEGLACNLRVHSATGHVFIHRESRDLNTLMQYVYDSMKLSFQNWHKNQKHFAKTHPLEHTPCKSASHKKLVCPHNSFSDQKSS